MKKDNNKKDGKKIKDFSLTTRMTYKQICERSKRARQGARLANFY